ncbi:MAG: 50S ribosomal protein L13 [Chloroflexi bacterium]|nr:50S ribosomal protein L13 [Chloroflexota bacterium]
MKPYNPSASDLHADWHVIDADGQVLGRLGTQIARILMGKHKPGYVPHLLSGDFVVVINAEKVKITGNKAQQNEYLRHSQYPGHLKRIPYLTMQEKHPDRIVQHTVKGMLPKTKLGARMLSRLKIYAGPEHPHEAQVVGAEKARSTEGDA